jgi:hypothetical protein
MEAALPQATLGLELPCDWREATFQQANQVHEIGIDHKKMHVVGHHTPGKQLGVPLSGGGGEDIDELIS